MKNNKLWMAYLMCMLILSLGCMNATIAGTYNGQGSSKNIFEDQEFITFHAIGIGVQPENATSKGQAIFMAQRAALSDGYRQMAEKVRGVYIDAASRMGNGVVDYDSIRVSTSTLLRNVQLEQVKHLSNGITEAYLILKVKK